MLKEYTFSMEFTREIIFRLDPKIPMSELQEYSEM